MVTNDFHPKFQETVAVEKILSDLVPSFLKNKVHDLTLINALMQQHEYIEIKKIGHKWKGACPSYGFEYLGEVGKQFEILVQNQDYESLQTLIDTLPDYLKNVSVEYTTEY